ncbi:uncharacterized protein L3040_008006 [Drepanopeziza brunnea f. sp. 'multigermtubi']|uniref:Uncharacterized protein n=1 Tax=Marssonina brunnea f. sp. multigermtubi (strain MB_m1) TaxID=1072389 RepID=K1W9Q9_MARBU|nr:uncharacterized protein MBM_07667 [Drepanopeziza brunnea f. sp. 'multigermtubi' MB_m1]EKD13990.1 hypothetical protein MBM_07667 [Drepanopeziza brunnea f. sp. 'multigermtubi' MB_m1]KAJ5035540.1 hypothetical protein L3040_008006 [Drepanopeziza brunnea f. sp. 'multigermtubi']
MSESSPPPTSRRFSPTPVETTVKRVRRFAAEPVETTTRSSKKEEKKKETYGGVDATDFAATDAAPKRRFAPEPVETTFSSSRQPKPLPTSEPIPASIPQDSPKEHTTPRPRRRFVPELIETLKRSKKAGDSRPATLPTDKTDLTPGVPNIYTRPKKKSRLPAVSAPPDNIPNENSAHLQTTSPLPPRRQQSMRPHPNSRRSTRQNSFQPELEAIVSSDESSDEAEVNLEDEEGYGDDEGTPSLSGSFGSSEDSMMRLQLARTRESCDDRFSGYLLALAAKAAEKQMREQALAAFPNESMHHIVEHFYDREIEGASDEESVEGVGLLVLDDPKLDTICRKSTEVGWAAKEMQQHQEKLNRLREDEVNAKIAAEATQPTFPDPFWTNGMTVKTSALARAQDEPIDKQKEAELKRMRLAASPPMLGSDLKFRMCPSPKATKFESDQRINVQQPNRDENGGGLWGGYCVAEEPGEFLSPSINKQPALIHTPLPQGSGDGDPFSSAFSNAVPSGAKTPSRPAGGPRMLTGIDDRLKAEMLKAKQDEVLLAEFDATFVTQVYNYLSLGYPSLARNYDEELAQVSRVPIEELRAEDSKKNAKGYIGITEGVKEEYCPRWKALRVYILEWARQHPSMSNGAASPGAWGVRARRGSWAI